MSFRVGALAGASSGQAEAPGVIDYRLARMSLISEFRKGRLARHEVCDCHPELLRAARNVGDSTDRECPICEEHFLVLVTYAFGHRLPQSGTCVTEPRQMAKLKRTVDDLTCYVVEVCPACRWNHLAKTFLVGKAVRG